jgi:polypeptide N-acetylgalactosaminyltransferase
VIFLLTFLYSFNSNDTGTSSTSPLPHAGELRLEELEVKKSDGHRVVVREAEKADDQPNQLEPIMTEGVLGNYELKNVLKKAGPGEDGEGVNLEGPDIQRGQESVAEYGFNEVVSEKISLDRRARDTR